MNGKNSGARSPYGRDHERDEMSNEIVYLAARVNRHAEVTLRN